MKVQHVFAKIFIESPEEIDMEAFIHVFHGWIQNGIGDEMLLDVADYRHVVNGPQVLLIAHEADYSLDSTGGRLGLVYSRKAVIDGSTETCFRQALTALARACRRLESEERFGGALKFSRGELELGINDRALAPNTAATHEALEPVIKGFFQVALGHDDFAIEHASSADSRELFRVHVTCGKPMVFERY